MKNVDYDSMTEDQLQQLDREYQQMYLKGELTAQKARVWEQIKDALRAIHSVARRW